MSTLKSPTVTRTFHTPQITKSRGEFASACAVCRSRMFLGIVGSSSKEGRTVAWRGRFKGMVSSVGQKKPPAKGEWVIRHQG